MNNLKNLKPYYIGQKVVCITPEATTRGWIANNEASTGPKYKEIVTVSGYGPENYVILKEYTGDGGYNVKHFKPAQEATLPLISYSKVLEEVPVGSN